MKKIFLRILLPLLCLLSIVAWMFFFPNIAENKQNQVFNTCWIATSFLSSVMILSIWDMLLNKIITWRKHPIIRFFLQLVFGTLLALLCINVTYQLIREYYTFTSPDLGQVIIMNLYGSALILPLFSMYFGYQFLRDWRKSEIETERLQTENARSQMMTLKNHLDPHFLFNNLNILSSLMDKDTKLSKDYLDKFAEVYRIILKSEHSDLVSLDEEMKLISSYIYLLNIRFGDTVFFKEDLPRAMMDKVLPPLSIQMLIENAIKHNMASKDKPITIEILAEAPHTLIVKNNLQKRKYAIQERKGSGLENIKNRYEFFSDKEVKILQTDEIFEVRLPLLDIDYD